MASLAQKISLGSSPTTVVIATVVTFVAAFVGYNMWIMSKTMPSASGSIQEGFGGVAVGSGLPDCVRTSSEAASLADFFVSRESSAPESSGDDLREFLRILSKLSCFKKDLLGAAGVVEATRYQPYSTAHDVESIAETTARCFAKTIPPRDLDISFDKWTSRGNSLIRRLCTAYDVKPTELDTLKGTFSKLIEDVKDVAKSSCLSGTPVIGGKSQGREPTAYQPNELIDLGAYKGRY